MESRGRGRGRIVRGSVIQQRGTVSPSTEYTNMYGCVPTPLLAQMHSFDIMVRQLTCL
jgi:hypothetical protein